MEKQIKYAIFAIPTREGKIFANKKPEIVSELYDTINDELYKLCEDFNQTNHYDELTSHYAIRPVK